MMTHAQAVRGNLKKAQRVWSQISRVLRAENASARVCGIFYKATVQAVLLFGRETWWLAPATLKRLEGFHVKAARQMTGLLPKITGGTWKYPKTKTVLAAAGLHTIEYYVQVRRARILRWVEDIPILKMCWSADRRRGTTPRLHWWEQPIELDDTSRGTPPAVAAEEDRGDGGRAPLATACEETQMDTMRYAVPREQGIFWADSSGPTYVEADVP